MKKLQNTILSVVAKAGRKTAEKACCSASLFYCYQPKEPAMLKKSVKK